MDCCNEDASRSRESPNSASGGGGGGGACSSGDLRRSASSGFQPCVSGTSIAQERDHLSLIRRIALDIDEQTVLQHDLRAVEFAFQYVRADRTKRQANIMRSKAKAKERRQRERAQGLENKR